MKFTVRYVHVLSHGTKKKKIHYFPDKKVLDYENFSTFLFLLQNLNFN